MTAARDDDDERDAQFMRRAIRLAMNGRGRVEPNPMVGCVIVEGDRVIGAGFHQQFGGAHAEPNALASCTESPQGATAYVTLEPCCHTNKKTPPCVPRLIEAKLARVVIGCLDPNPDVDGKGVAMLRAAGIEVVPSSLQDAARQLIAPFVARTSLGRPYVTLKWAQSADGYVAGRLGGAPLRITNAASDRIVHELRSRCDAIAIGTNTVLNDDPLLTARGVERPRARPLLRVVLSNSLKISPNARLIVTAREHPIVVYSSESSIGRHADTVRALRAAGAEVVGLPVEGTSAVTGEGRFSFAAVLRDLHGRGVTHLLIEPGPTLARSMLARGQVDRIWVFRSTTQVGASDVMSAPQVDYPATGSIDLAGDTLTEYLNPASPAFFAAEPSADFVAAGDAGQK
jgi:diaminohydroxyphosphoribosylaminopyrimidine deaminase/5-amino-6-(5-phosphoribosylamino)uracil reductase